VKTLSVKRYVDRKVDRYVAPCTTGALTLIRRGSTNKSFRRNSTNHGNHSVMSHGKTHAFACRTFPLQSSALHQLSEIAYLTFVDIGGDV